MNATAYDTVFYASKLNRTRHIDYLGTVAKLFGISLPAPFATRVLEIGCATGDALFPLAEEYPQSDFVGIDVSPAQISEAIQRKKSLMDGSNLTFHAGTVDDYALKNPDAKFDYIICHGVFSWIPKEQQQALLHGIKRLLSKNGVCLLSYNAAPGSSFRKLVWDQLKKLAITAQAKTTAEHRRIIESLRDLVEVDFEKPYQYFVYQELTRISREPDHYLVHEVFADDNYPISYVDLKQELDNDGLEIFSDVKPHLHGIHRLMSAAVAPEAFSEFSKLKTMGLAEESVMDLIFHTPFRTSLLRHTAVGELMESSDLALFQGVDFHQFKAMSFGFCGAIIECDDPSVLAVQSQTGKEERISHPILRTIIELLQEGYPYYQSFSSLLEKTARLLALEIEPDDVCRAISEAFAREILIPSHYPPQTAQTVRAFPKTTAWIRYQAAAATKHGRGAGITNLHYQTVELDSLAVAILEKLDGTTGHEVLEETARRMIKSGQGGIMEDGKPVTDTSALEALVPIVVESALETLKKAAMLLP